MEKLKFNPDNKKYYSEEFIKGFECGVERQFNADMEEKTTINSTKTTITDGDLISRKAVIDGINAYIDKAQYSGTIDVFILFEELVVKSLPAVKPLKKEQTDGDLISRDFMKKLGATCIATRNEKGELVAISSIDNLPSAEKTAEWKPLDKEKAQYYMFGYVCSKCGAPAKSPTKYCSNCGAKICMEEIKDET